MKKIRIILVSLFLIFASLFALYNLFFDENTSKYSDAKDMEKNKFGGKVVNKANHKIKITDSTRPLTVPSDKTSKDIGLFDADGIVIERPTIFEGKSYKYGVIKICDISSAKVTTIKGTDKITVSPSYLLCGLFEKVGWFPSIQEAFPPQMQNIR